MIEVKNITKKYGPNLAVDNINFTIEPGKVYGFLGPNGAGKSTTMNIMTGCLAATEGQVLINGHDIFEEPKLAKKAVGYLPEIPPVYVDMTPREYLMFVGEAKGLRGKELRENVSYAMEQARIMQMQNRLIKSLSKGYRQRVGLAQAIMGNPEVVILDEPTVGLDPSQIIEMRTLIKNLGKKHTVILSSHILSEVSAVCDVVLIISRGRLVAIDTPENLSRAMTGGSMVTVTVSGEEDAARRAAESIEGVKSVDVKPATEKGLYTIRIESDGEEDIRARVSMVFATAGMPVLSMTSGSATLEDVFLELTRESGVTADAYDEEEKKQLSKKGKKG